MANWKLIGGIAGGVFVLGAIGNAIDGGDSKDATSSASSGTSASTPAGTTETADSKPASSDDKPETKAVPNFIGMGLQTAQDHAQAAGFYALTSHDSLGRARMQILDRDWKVCSQSVKASKTVPTDTELDFGAVKLKETCPAKDQTEPTAAGATMPDFTGKSVKAAHAALDSGTSVTTTDASGDGRYVLIESNWQVCSQTPKAGAKLNGQPVEFTAVKFGESCA